MKEGALTLSEEIYGKELYDEPKFGPVGKEVFERTYQRNKQDGTKETWADTVKRVVGGNTSLVADRYIESGERDKLFELIYNFKMLPAGRHLWVSGVPGRQFLFNCHRAGFTSQMSEHYGFAFDQLMQGGGVGANYSNRYIGLIPNIQNTVDVHIVCDKSHPDFWELPDVLSSEYSSDWDGAVRIEDSREGWVDALERVIDLHFMDEAQVIVLDISLIRERGKKIKGFGGKASGPFALANMLHSVNVLMNGKINKQLSSLDHMVIDHEIARCVVAGNVRRSARMSIKSWKDRDIFEFINCKQDSLMHWTTNISVEIDDDFFKALKSHDQLAKDVYTSLVEGMLKNGEPGIYNLSLAQDGEFGDVASTNPCVTGDTWITTSEGARQVKDLLGKPFIALIDGKRWASGHEGFFGTGEKPVLELKTTEGYKLKLTKYHKVLTPNGWVEAGTLESGDKIIIHNHRDNESNYDDINFASGYMIGHFFGDGTFTRNAARLSTWSLDAGSDKVRAYLDSIAQLKWRYNSEQMRQDTDSKILRDHMEKEFNIVNKTITTELETADMSIIAGFISGMFDTDGHVEGSGKTGGISIRLSQSNLNTLEAVQRMLLRFGIRCHIQLAREAGERLMPDGKGGSALYKHKDQWRLIISGNDTKIFIERIGFKNPDKAGKWFGEYSEMTKGFYNKPFEATVLSVVKIEKEYVYDVNIPGINAFDANGIYVHNCGEITLEPWENCNLGHVNLSAFADDFEASKEAFRLMSRFLIRATFGDIPQAQQKEVVDRNRRIGVGFFGFQGWLVKNGIKFSDSHRDRYVRKTLKDWKAVVDKEKRRYAFQLRIPEPIKGTTVAPTGSVAKLAGGTEGAGSIYSRFFERRIRFADNDPALIKYEQQGYKIEDCMYTPNTKVVSFICKDQLMDEPVDLDLIEQANEISLSDMLGVQAMIQDCYADNAISFTVNIEPDTITVDEAEKIIIHYLPHLKGTTIMPDGSRPQAPYERITEAEYNRSEYLKTVDSGYDECSNGSCPIK